MFDSVRADCRDWLLLIQPRKSQECVETIRVSNGFVPGPPVQGTRQKGRKTAPGKMKARGFSGKLSTIPLYGCDFDALQKQIPFITTFLCFDEKKAFHGHLFTSESELWSISIAYIPLHVC